VIARRTEVREAAVAILGEDLVARQEEIHAEEIKYHAYSNQDVDEQQARMLAETRTRMGW
jgi:hypothetical protein